MQHSKTLWKNKEQLCNLFKHAARVVAYEQAQEKLPNTFKEIRANFLLSTTNNF